MSFHVGKVPARLAALVPALTAALPAAAASRRNRGSRVFRFMHARMLHGLAAIAVTVGLSLPAVALLAQPAAAAASSSAELDQCTNGSVSPLSPQPCLGSGTAASAAITGINGGAKTSYKNWVTGNGNVNGTKSHWQEGEFIAYRTVLSGLSSGSHTLTFSYNTVGSGGHAIDYLGSYDATETTSS